MEYIVNIYGRPYKLNSNVPLSPAQQKKEVDKFVKQHPVMQKIGLQTIPGTRIARF